jgi:hypothetical protein
MRGVAGTRGKEKVWDERGRFVARATQPNPLAHNGLIVSPRTRSRPLQEGRAPEVGEQAEYLGDGEVINRELQPVSTQEAHQLTFSEEDTEQWVDVDEEESWEHRPGIFRILEDGRRC